MEEENVPSEVEESSMDILEAELQRRMDGRTSDLWLFAFSEGDDDLLPSGTFGIRSLEPWNGSGVRVFVGGSKTVSGRGIEAVDAAVRGLAEDTFVPEEILDEDGEPCYRFDTDEELLIDYETRLDGSVDVALTVKEILESAEKALSPFYEEMRELSESIMIQAGQVS